MLAHLASFDEEVAAVDLDGPVQPLPSLPEEPAELFPALVLGLRDYFAKCSFRSAVLGLSGGIDSAVTAALAVEALGAENVLGVAMPSAFSSKGSVADALALAENLGIRCLQIPIREPFDAFKKQFRDVFAGGPRTRRRRTCRRGCAAWCSCRFPTKFGSLLLTTGNKSELAVGYCTLYGDMAGGLAVISDVPKTSVYRLANYINREKELIPVSTIEKPPSAELKPDQKDQDTLPPYDVLDRVLQLYVEENLSAVEIIAKGFDPQTVRWIQRRVDLNEYKRAQAVPGLKVTSRAFGSGRRMPIAQRFRGVGDFQDGHPNRRRDRRVHRPAQVRQQGRARLSESGLAGVPGPSQRRAGRGVGGGGVRGGHRGTPGRGEPLRPGGGRREAAAPSSRPRGRASCGSIPARKARNCLPQRWERVSRRGSFVRSSRWVSPRRIFRSPASRAMGKQFWTQDRIEHRQRLR